MHRTLGRMKAGRLTESHTWRQTCSQFPLARKTSHQGRNWLDLWANREMEQKDGYATSGQTNKCPVRCHCTFLFSSSDIALASFTIGTRATRSSISKISSTHNTPCHYQNNNSHSLLTLYLWTSRLSACQTQSCVQSPLGPCRMISSSILHQLSVQLPIPWDDGRHRDGMTQT